MINPRTVRVAFPSYSGNIPAESVGSLVHCCKQYGEISFTIGVSMVALARNFVAQKFLNSTAEWLVTIDDDIIFLPSDFAFLMEPYYGNDGNTHEAPTRVEVTGIAWENPREPTEYPMLADAIVCAEYAYKDESLRAVRNGLGFTRIHRSVFETMRDMKHEDGTPRLFSAMSQGVLCTDFFPTGAILSQIIPGAEWTGEDHAFFMLAKLAGFTPRIETRTRLHHLGKKAYPYHGDNMSGAQ